MRPHPPSSSSSSMVSGEQKEMRDRISQLPDEILIHILCFLPTTKLRAATSILSRRWRHLWACCPSLDLHCKLYAKKSVPGITSKLVLGISYCRFVDHCLRACRAATLARFAVDVGTLFMEANVLTDHDALLNEARHRADRWVRLAAGRSVEELSLRNSWGMPIVRFETPLSVLACARSLTRLKLQYCYFANFPCRAGGFPSLRTLDLSGVIMPDEKLISLLSMCPLLERLSLQCYDYLQGVEVSSSVNPYLKDLKIGGLCRVVIDVPGLTSFQFSGQITLLSLKGAPPRLREAKVYSHQWDHRWRSWTRDDWKKIMSAISHVEILYVNARFFESMVAAASGDGKFEFRDLKVLIWVEDCITESNLNAFFSFVRGCPLLEKLYIVLRHIRSKDRPLYSFDEDAEGEQPPRHQSPPEEPPEEPTNKSSLPRLKSATVIKFSNRRHEMRLVEQLLREAGVLERLQVLQQFRPAKGMEKGKIRKQVCRLPRASPTAHIQYSIMNAAKRRSWKRFWAF